MPDAKMFCGSVMGAIGGGHFERKNQLRKCRLATLPEFSNDTFFSRTSKNNIPSFSRGKSGILKGLSHEIFVPV
jgi:hypothetical protein